MNYILISTEGRSENEIKYNLDATLSSFLEFDYTITIEKDTVMIKRKSDGTKVAETDGELFAGSAALRFMACFYDSALTPFLKQDIKYQFSKEKNGFILSTPPFKTMIIFFKKETLVALENSLIFNIMAYYTKNFESKGLNFNPNILPFFINYEEEYQVPMSIYRYMHEFDRSVQMYFLKRGSF